MIFRDITEICLRKIKQSKARYIYLLGADDTGKTTLTKELANRLILEGSKVAIIGADPGQSNRLPLTLSFNYGDMQFRQFSELMLIDWGFILGYNLMKWFERYAELMECWIKKEASYCLIDSSGDTRKALKLKERIERIFPSYLASLEKTSQLPGEFERRWWASRVEALLEKVKTGYQKYQARAKEADFVGKFMTLGIDAVLKAGGMQPVTLPASLQVGISISPSGKIEPAIFDDPNRQPDTILVNFEEFEAIALRLKDELLKGTIMSTREDEMPKLVYGLVAEQK